MKIVLSPDPILRQVCQPCIPGDKSLKKLAKQMAKDMYDNNGCGLAAPQVGILKRIIVIDCDNSEFQNPIALVNPDIIEASGEPVIEEEGCLSLPGISVPISRKPFVRVKYFDLEGNECMIEGDGLLGRCLQHEIDHLNGRTLFESASPMDRIIALREYETALASGARPGEIGADDMSSRFRNR